MGLEQLVTQDAIAVTSRLMLKMNDMKNSALDQLCRALFNTNGGNPLIMYGLNDAYGATGNYGGLDRTTYPAWAGRVVTAPSGVTDGVPDALTRKGFIQFLLECTRNAGGEAPDFAVCSIEDWTTLMGDFMALERYNNDPSSRWGKDDPVNSGFRGLLLGDTPIFFDLQCPQGTAYLFNSRYIALVVHQDANFAWTGWYSTLPQGQIASVGLTLTALNLVCSKPATGMIVESIPAGVTFT
jgi:hypothetical protein